MKERFYFWLAYRLPRRVAYLAFVRVYASAMEPPSPEFERVSNGWSLGAGT